MGKDTPEPPDYQAAAVAQAESSKENLNMQNYANRPTQVTPFGTQYWETQRVIDPATGDPVTHWTQYTTLDDDLAKALEDQQDIQAGRSELALGLFDRVGDEFGPMVDWSKFTNLEGAPNVPVYRPNNYDTSGYEDLMSGVMGGVNQYGTGEFQQFNPNYNFDDLYSVGDPNDIRQEAEDAIYGRLTSRLDPQWDDREEALDVQLRGQGLVPGTEAYDKARANYDRARNDAYADAQYQAIIGGGQEADRMFGQQMQRRQQGVEEIMQKYGLDFQTASYFNDLQSQILTDQLRAGGQGFQELLGGSQFSNQMLQAIMGAESQEFQEAMAAGSQGFNQGLAVSNLTNTIRQQEIAEEMQRRGWTLNEINAVLTGQQVGMPSMPGFNTSGIAETTQHLSAANMGFQAEMDAFNAEQAAIQGMMSGVANIAGGFMPI